MQLSAGRVGEKQGRDTALPAAGRGAANRPDDTGGHRRLGMRVVRCTTTPRCLRAEPRSVGHFFLATGKQRMWQRQVGWPCSTQRFPVPSPSLPPPPLQALPFRSQRSPDLGGLLAEG